MPHPSVLCIFLMQFLVVGTCWCGPTASAVRETVEVVARQFGKQVADEGSEAVASRITRLAEKYGDDALLAAKKAGPTALRVVEESGDDAAKVVRLFATHGDDAMRVASDPARRALFIKVGDDAAIAMIKHPGIGEDLVVQLGKNGAKAISKLGSEEANHLVRLTNEGFFKEVGRGKILDAIERYGDRAMAFIWRNKGPLATTAGLAAFLNDPEPFIEGVNNFGGTLVDGIFKPLVEGAVGNGWVLGIWGVFGIVVLGFLGFRFMKKMKLV